MAYANNMFVFENEVNMKLFMEDPKKFLAKEPELPKSFRMLMTGARGIGVHT